jgi:MFS family permease
LAVSVTVGYGVLSYAFAVVLVPMQRDLGWSQAVFTGAFSLALAVAALAGIPIGMALDRVPPRRILPAGAALGALAVVAWSRVTTVAELYLVFAVVGLAMSATLYPAALTVVTKWTGRRRQAAITTVTVLGSSASLLFSPLTAALDDALGWRSALLVLAGLLALVVPLQAAALRRPPALGAEDRHVPGGAMHAWAPGRAPGFWMLTACFAAGAFAWSAMTIHLVALLVGRGHSVAAAGAVAGVMGISQLPGRLAFGVLLRDPTRVRTLLMAYGLSVAALILLAASRSAPAAMVAAVGYGAAAGMLTILGATVPAELFGSARFGAAFGVMSACATGARAVAPLVGSALATAAGGYSTLLWALAAVTALAAALGAAGLRTAIGAARLGPAG